MVRRFAAAFAALALLFVVPTAAWSHPLHTTLAEASLEADGSLRLTIRAFADDFSAAVARHAGKPRPADFNVNDADVAAYVAATLVVRSTDGRPVPLVWAGAKRTGDLMWVTVRAPAIRSLNGIRIVYTTLFETFNDQVNILQANDNGRRRTVLFTAGDGRVAKTIG